MKKIPFAEDYIYAQVDEDVMLFVGYVIKGVILDSYIIYCS
jgi:hypothetical protein